MSLCAFGSCQKPVGARWVTKTWLDRSSLPAEEKNKLAGKFLCNYHYNTTITANAATAKPPPLFVVEVPKPLPECVGIANSVLEKFWEEKYGFVCTNPEGFPIGGRLQGQHTHRSFHCTGFSRTMQSQRCESCFALHNIYQCARTRSVHSEENGTTKFTTLASIKASPHAKSVLEKFYHENKALKEELSIRKHIEEQGLEVDDEADNDFLINVVSKVIDNNKDLANTFVLQFLKQQLNCLSSTSGRGFRWHKEVVQWALTLQFHGGKMLIDDLRGKAFNGQGSKGHLNVDVANWGIFLPANSTLRNYLPPVKVYSGLSSTKVENFKKAFPTSSPRKAFLCWDEIEIRAGLVWNPSTKELLGRTKGPIAEKEVQTQDWVDMMSQLATHALQFFLVSLDGTFSDPIGFFPTHGVQVELLMRIFDYLEATLRVDMGDKAISLCATISDAFVSNGKFMAEMKSKHPSVPHLFDALHNVKNLRNSINNGEVVKDKIGFSLCTLDSLLTHDDQTIRQKFQALHPLSPFPKDTMDMAPIEALLKADLSRELRLHSDTAAKLLGEYLEQVRTFQECFSDNDMDHAERFQKLDSFLVYLSTVIGLTDGLKGHLTVSVQGLKKMSTLCEESGCHFVPSIFGTIVVENFFSQVRRKVRYPSLWEYAVFSRRAEMELIKQNAQDYLFVGAKKGGRIGKKYLNQKGIKFSMENIKLLTKREKREEYNDSLVFLLILGKEEGERKEDKEENEGNKSGTCYIPPA